MKLQRFYTTTIIFILSISCIDYSYSQYPAPRNDPIVIQIVELEHAEAEELAEVLKPFLSKDGRITAYAPGNSIIIKDRKSIVEELVKAIKGRLEYQD
jgi:type II secretory pathway component GspD/PulD (secretin)